MNTPLLTTEDLACSRGGLIVLAGVSLAIAPGQALVLRGPNGSGKTTLLRTIAGLQPPEAGKINTDPDTLAYAAHADGIKGTLSVAENLSFWAALFGTRDIDTALDAFELRPLKGRPAQALSAGQKRRLGLARLFVTARPLWVLDEPTVSLDTHAVAMFAEAVKTHLAGGGAAIIATHIDLGFDTDTLDISPFKPTRAEAQAFDEAFL